MVPEPPETFSTIVLTGKSAYSTRAREVKSKPSPAPKGTKKVISFSGTHPSVLLASASVVDGVSASCAADVLLSSLAGDCAVFSPVEEQALSSRAETRMEANTVIVLCFILLHLSFSVGAIW